MSFIYLKSLWETLLHSVNQKKLRQDKKIVVSNIITFIIHGNNNTQLFNLNNII